MAEEIRIMTLCLVRDGGGRVLFGRKTRKIGAGRWNGLGGGAEEEDTDIQATARREVWEESSRLLNEKTGEREGGIIVGELIEQGVVDFKFPDMNRINRVYMFSTNDWSGEPMTNDEMSEFGWFAKDELPLDEMLEADSHFIPELMEGKRIRAEFVYDNEFHLREFTIEEVEQELVEPVIELNLR